METTLDYDQHVIDEMMSEDASACSSDSRRAMEVRGRELGLTPSFIRGCRLSGARPSMRACIKCEERFLSTGAHNRLCRRCRG